MRWVDPAADRGGGASSAPRLIDIGWFALAVAMSAFVLLWTSPPGPPLFPYADKLLHAVLFLAVAWSGSRVLPVGALAPGLVVYAIGTKVVQHTLLPGRAGGWTDVVADLIGATAGILLAHRRPETGRER